MIDISPLHPVFAITIYLVAYLTGYTIYAKKKITAIGRFETIDGLRGFLALGVFIHHAHIWYYFIHGAGWHAPKSHLYNQLGQTSVSLFFMITSFLFISKLLQSKEKPFDWIYFFISRICRLAPMYYVSITIVGLIVFQLSEWRLNVSPFELIREAFHWGAFTITTTPTINDFDKTSIINAGVIWSLPFEWLFYFSLPLIALLILDFKPKLIFLIISLTFIILFTIAHGVKPQHILSFCGGAIAPFLIKFPPIIRMAKSNFGSIAILLCLLVISLFQSADETVCKMAIIVLFTIVALGNSFFGILKNKTVKLLGEMAYSTYLLHGIILFSVLYLGFGLEIVKQFSEFEYAILIFSITPIVVILSYFGFRFIEKPAMDYSKKINQHFQPHK